MNYLQWNDIIAKHFFNLENAGKEVLLYVNKDLIEELGQSNSCGQDDFVRAVKEGPDWTTRSGFCQKALQACNDWRSRGLVYPPYISYLACFVLAAGTGMKDVRATAYYPRLNKLLGEPENTPIRSFDKMSELWEDLEKWSREDKHEELGRFVFGIQGKMIWVGLPRFQTLISAEERRSLKIVFAAAELDPADPPSQEVMLKRLLNYGDHLFQRKTKEVLKSTSGENLILREKLLEFVMDELEDWEGELPELEPSGSKRSFSIQSGIRLCMDLDEMAGLANFTIRLKTNRNFPEDPLRFQVPDGKILICKEASQNWSKIIRDEEGNLFDASKLSWEQGTQMNDSEQNWKARLKAANVRLFISGKNEGFSGWIETQRLERGMPFKLAVSEMENAKIKSWGEQHCEGFQSMGITGLPHGWKLFEGHNARQSCEDVDVLTLSSSVRLSFRGGVKVRGGNTYLHIAPPLITLENSSGIEIPSVNGQSLIRIDEESHLWSLPENTPINELLRIEVEVSGKLLHKIMRLEEPVLAVDYHAPKRNNLGDILPEQEEDTNTFSGAIAHIDKATPVSSWVFIRPSNRRCLFFLGEPGQICEWPVEQMPSWNPEWAIEKTGRKEWVVTYCRRFLDDTSLSKGMKKDKHSLKKWRELVWVKRKTTKLPDIPLVRNRWKKYVEAAKNV